MENKLPSRKQLRLADYNYDTPGAYFITICTHNKQNTLSHIVGAIHESPAIPHPTVGAIHESPEPDLTNCGIIVNTVIENLPDTIGAVVDRYVIMPNHIHLILFVTENNALRAIRESPLRVRSIVSNAVGYIKMNASRAIRRECGDVSVWQRGYYDHIIRNEQDYIAIAKYIEENPLKWELDKLYSKE